MSTARAGHEKPGGEDHQARYARSHEGPFPLLAIPAVEKKENQAKKNQKTFNRKQHPGNLPEEGTINQ